MSAQNSSNELLLMLRNIDCGPSLDEHSYLSRGIAICCPQTKHSIDDKVNTDPYSSSHEPISTVVLSQISAVMC